MNKLTSKIEVEISIKLIEYLKRKNIIDDEMYNYIINKFIAKHDYKTIT